MNVTELLAPAKDLECGKAAIDCGADALYIGAPKFGARENAGNSLSDIAELTAYAHKYWARVYVTLNILLYNDEIPLAEKMANELYEIGIDGLIIQDTGLLECDLPPIPLIASTQMHNNTPEKVSFLEKVGFSRAILARELDIDQIRAIREKTNIELECFIHGSLCVCYSGQCYLSYALGGRSGNRGQCAQPCRKLYSLVDSSGTILIQNSHLLSLKDLNLSDHLSELLDAGVRSFKIEGRLKDKAYVTNVVAFYRARLDEAIRKADLKKSSSGTSILGFTPDLNKTFNRDYTTYFLHGRSEIVGRPETPKMVGEEIGRVISAGQKYVKIDTSIVLHPGDGICFYNRKGELLGTVVNEVRGTTITPDKPKGIEPGITIYRNHDHVFLNTLKKAGVNRLISVQLTLTETADGLALAAVDEDDNSAKITIQCEKIAAEKPDQALENIKKQLAKTGATEFVCDKVSFNLTTPLFIPISVLNSLRRDVLGELVRKRDANRPIHTCQAAKNKVPYPQNKLNFEGNVLNDLARAFYNKHGVKEIEPAAESGLDLHGRKVMTTKYCLRKQFGMCGNNEHLTLVDEENNRLELKFDCKQCHMEIWLPQN